MRAPPPPRSRSRRARFQSGRLRLGATGLAAAIALVVFAIPAVARADDAQELELGTSALDAGQYDVAAKRFLVMLDPNKPTCDRGASGACRLSDPMLVERARIGAAIALVALKRKPEAETVVRDALRANPKYQPNPAIVPQEVRDLIAQVRVKLQQELEQIELKKGEEERLRRLSEQRARENEQRWIAELQRLAGQERVVRRNSRWLGLLPFGVGEFQNGRDAWGAGFAVTQAVTGLTSIIAGVIAFDAASAPNKDPQTGKPVDVAALQQRYQVAAAVNRVAFSLWAVSYVWSVVQAEIGFVPEVSELRTRPIPKRPPPAIVAPTVSILPGGAYGGLRGAF